MIDTVVLTLKQEQFRIHSPEKFTPNARNVLDMPNTRKQGERRITAYCNPSKADLLEGMYKPRLTLYGRMDEAGRYSITLRVECSFPKLIFGNNFAELTDGDFVRVLDTLSDRLALQGVASSFHDLKYAEVSAIHYGKNILLTDHLTCGSILHALAKVNVNGWLDVSKTDYRNAGHLYKVHSNDFELAFYDKVKDLEKAQKSPKRAYEQDIAIQQNLLNVADFERRKQVLRMEARLGSRRKIRDVLEKIHHPSMGEPESALTLERLYSQALAQRVLLHYWEPYRISLPSIATPAGKTSADLYRQIAQAMPYAKDAHILKLVAAYGIVNEVGWPGFKSLWTSTPRTLARLRKELDGQIWRRLLPWSGLPRLKERSSVLSRLQWMRL